MTQPAVRTRPPFVDEQGRVDLKCLAPEELETFVFDVLGERAFRAKQIYKWIWQRGVSDFDEMSNISKPVRQKLKETAFISFLETDTILRSADGTVKYVWKLGDGRTIESVLIPDGDRLTLCMSTQVGCAMACTFCLTGDLGLIRQLNPSEIANQPLQVARDIPEDKRITNLVLMGMGEPLHNLDNLTVALNIALDDDALNYSHRKITVSTVGLVPKMGELAARLPVNLAVSLNATTEEQRRQIMPVTRKYSLEELLQACRDFPLPRGKRITFEYVMFDGFNDTLEDARRLYNLLKGIKAKVNLIPYNQNPERDLEPPPPEVVKSFQHFLVSRGMSCTVRVTRGRDISAACGQLGKARQQITDGLV